MVPFCLQFWWNISFAWTLNYCNLPCHFKDSIWWLALSLLGTKVFTTNRTSLPCSNVLVIYISKAPSFLITGAFSCIRLSHLISGHVHKYQPLRINCNTYIMISSLSCLRKRENAFSLNEDKNVPYLKEINIKLHPHLMYKFLKKHIWTYLIESLLVFVINWK